MFLQAVNFTSYRLIRRTLGRFQYVARITVDVTFVQLMVLAKSLEQVVTMFTTDIKHWQKRKIDWNMSGQRRNNFNTSYRDRSVVVADNSCVVKPKCQQYPSLNEMLSNFSKVLIVHISFTAVISNGDIGKGIGGIRNSAKKNHIYIL